MLVLASASPRRRELLTQAGYTFRVIPSSIPEERLLGEEPSAFVARLAREKAQTIFDQRPGEAELLVLGADTIVVVSGDILGKPQDAGDAARMLRRLSGQIHQVLTGVCLVAPTSAETAVESTSVTMRAISEEEMQAYIASGEPMDKAGAYGIQGYAARWIPRIEGCYFNVVGLPIARVAAMIGGRSISPAPRRSIPT